RSLRLRLSPGAVAPAVPSPRRDGAFFFFQAEDGIRDGHVTGVQTCALPIYYNVSTGHGLFQNVHGTFKIERQPNDQVLLTDNPLYFEARTVERFAGDLYFVQRAWITICDPGRPKWQFYAPEARIRLDKTVALVNANFRLFRVPLIWLPYATAPAGRKVRQSGFLIPDIGQSSRKGF